MQANGSIIIGIALLLGSVTAQATDYTWTGGGAAGMWTDNANWSPDTGYPSGAGDTGAITNTADDIDAPAGLTLGALTLDEDYTGTLTLGGTLTVDGDGNGPSSNLTVNAGTLQTGADIISGITVAGRFAIGTDGTVVVRRSTTSGEGEGQTITATTMTVAGTLHADEQGFNTGSGPSPGDGSITGGASHAGSGGLGISSTRVTYGSFSNPTALGSGGTSGDTKGGGAIVLNIVETLSVSGRISADGGGNVALTAGAGAGGSINITAAELVGDGTIQAVGGTVNRGGGGGGRISVAQVAAIDFTGEIKVDGGLSGARARGHAGTIALPAGYDLTLSTNGISTLRLGTDDDAAYFFGSITVKTNAVLEIDGHPRLNNLQGTAATITVGSIDVQKGGRISADGLGYWVNTTMGPGAADTADLTAATHGGEGGNNTKETYGSLDNPVSLGSGARSAGGGAVILRVAGEAKVSGTISANGLENGSTGGAGGSVYIMAALLSGAGKIQASGGSPVRYGGGGGRIALVAPSSTFDGEMEAVGGLRGAATRTHGAAGTIYIDLNGRRRLVIHNDKDVEDNPDYTWLPGDANAPDPYPNLAAAALTIDNLARVALSTSITVGNLDLGGGTAATAIYLNGYTLTVRSLKPAGWDAIEATAVQLDGGEIIWARPGTLMTLR